MIDIEQWARKNMEQYSDLRVGASIRGDHYAYGQMTAKADVLNELLDIIEKNKGCIE